MSGLLAVGILFDLEVHSQPQKAKYESTTHDANSDNPEVIKKSPRRRAASSTRGYRRSEQKLAVGDRFPPSATCDCVCHDDKGSKWQ